MFVALVLLVAELPLVRDWLRWAAECLIVELIVTLKGVLELRFDAIFSFEVSRETFLKWLKWLVEPWLLKAVVFLCAIVVLFDFEPREGFE